MITDFKMFEANTAKIGIVGIPSGEYIELPIDQFYVLNDRGFLEYNHDLRFLSFKDKDYKNIMSIIDSSEKTKIKKFLSDIGVKRYKINDDYTIDVIESMKIRIPMDNLPVKFDYIMGDFDISGCGLTSLMGCPETIDGNFICTNNMLKDLSMGPTQVLKNYDVRQSGLYSLEGSPEKVGGNFDCSYNNLANLKGSPKFVDGSFYCSNCLLTSLNGAPDIVSDDFDCSYNLLHSLFGGPDIISGKYDCSYNDIMTLNNGPTFVGSFKCDGNTKLPKDARKPVNFGQKN